LQDVGYLFQPCSYQLTPANFPYGKDNGLHISIICKAGIRCLVVNQSNNFTFK